MGPLHNAQLSDFDNHLDDLDDHFSTPAVLDFVASSHLFNFLAIPHWQLVSPCQSLSYLV